MWIVKFCVEFLHVVCGYARASIELNKKLVSVQLEILSRF